MLAINLILYTNLRKFSDKPYICYMYNILRENVLGDSMSKTWKGNIGIPIRWIGTTGRA